MADLTNEHLAVLAVYAQRRDPDLDSEIHTFLASCPWCQTRAHDLAAALVSEVERLRAEVERLRAELGDAYGFLAELRRMARDENVSSEYLRGWLLPEGVE